MSLIIRQMRMEDIEPIYHAFAEHQINKPMDYLRTCWEENQTGVRITWVAVEDDQPVGAVHLLVNSHYVGFSEEEIPEINDFNVIPPFRKRGIGHALMDAAEQFAIPRYGAVGIGVGLFGSYGSAQRLYAKRGYIPDGKGIAYRGESVEQGSTVKVDHDLALYLTKSG
ncbi:GNAT family N-acetyltransferase [Gorillibacterium sp. CAU 1737]|uniref:GNAT family N-acetyltransferase n=1 Tax=Gorillibacterium sp. CAU 1737 TaxID=3140362 RepID=UPI003260A0AE